MSRKLVSSTKTKPSFEIVKRSFFTYCKKEKKYFKIAVGQLNQCSYLHFQTCEFYRNNETLLFKNLQILKVLRKHTPRGWKSAEIKRPGLFFFLEKHVSAIEKWNFFDGELRFLAVLWIVYIMPCPFTGPKMFSAGVNHLCQTKNLFTYCGSHKYFVPDKKMVCTQ